MGSSSSAEEEALSAAPPRLLNDNDVRHFIVHGFVKIEIPSEEVPSATLSAVHERTERLWAEANDCGLNETNAGFFGSGRFTFPHVPELGGVLGSPTLRGAVASLLGPNFVQHPHRSMHVRTAAEQEWHRDGTHPPMRHHFPRYLIGFFYPGSVTGSDGPSALLPSSQYLHRDGLHQRLRASSQSGLVTSAAVAASVAQLDSELREYQCVCRSGTLLLMHYDVYHRGCAQGLNPSWRGMFKLNFFRASVPAGPSWHHTPGASTWSESSLDTALTKRLAPVHRAVWAWMLADHRSTKAMCSDPAEVERLVAVVDDPSRSESERIGAAYALGVVKGGARALGALLMSQRECVSRAAMYGLTAAGDAGATDLLSILPLNSGFGACHRIHALHALGDAMLTPPALPRVCKALLETLDASKSDAEQFIATGGGTELAFVDGCAVHIEGSPVGVVKCRVIAGCIRAIGCVGERCVLESARPGMLALVASLCEAITTFTARQWLHTHPTLHVDDGTLQADDVNVHWCQEAAASALVQMCSTHHPVSTSHRPHRLTPAQHRDPRIAPALCLLAAERAQEQVGLSRHSSHGLRAHVGDARATLVCRLVPEWREVMRMAVVEAAVEPWLVESDSEIKAQREEENGLFVWFRSDGTDQFSVDGSESGSDVTPRL